jgi:hypothetical protein
MLMKGASDMKHAILFYETQDNMARRSDSDYMKPWNAYMAALNQAGVMRGGQALQGPGTGTTVRLRGNQRDVHDGPYADTKEQLGGFIIIEVATLDEALEWAARAPSSTSGGATEVRPIWEVSQTTAS